MTDIEDRSDPRRDLPRGQVIISLDAELAWGFHDLPDPPRARIDHARASWRRLLSLFDEFQVPATWAVVGHLFLESCDGVHAAHPAPPGWFAADPGGSGETDWLGRDLVRAIQGATVDHEIGSHTFSHVLFGGPSTSAALVEAEMEAARKLAAATGVELRSLTFPRNLVGHRAVLAEQGIRSYRAPEPGRWFEDGPLPRVGKVSDFALGRTAPPVVTPTVDEYGLVAIPGSLYLYSFEGPVNALVTAVVGDPIVEQVRLGIEAAIAQEKVLHLWLHPNDLTRESHFERFRAILALVSDYRTSGLIDVLTMDEMATVVLDTAQTDQARSPPARS